MASMETLGLDDLILSINQISQVPDNVKKRALKAMANIAKAKEKAVGEAKGIRDPESNVHVLDSFKINSPKVDDDGGTISITFSGTRTRGNTTTRNAEIAFINEFGCDRRNIPARPFISTALAEAGEEINGAGAEIIQDWIEKNLK